MHRTPRDPQGPKARRFAAWLRRDGKHRQRALQTRLTSQYRESENWGELAAWLLVSAIVAMGLWRLLAGTMFP